MDAQTGPRDRIVNAAGELFLARSYTGVGIAEICAAADVRKGTLYHFFPSKAEVARAVLDRHADAFTRQSEQAEREARAAESGELRPGVDPDHMARALLAQIEGGILPAKARTQSAREIVEFLDDVLDLYLVKGAA
ncbi:hypothetical protein NCCP2495_00810 [Dietzia sp. NCCP-2495]|uniref:TetR/AcrR family transcriptional regulator n=1 Tax=Dietzia sp. NCCP-2495 TaxID=2934675 RepID=UPI00223052F0|nr:TetR/AcrR family transcriptional regulator [Dietzia sp. NCCP-2495]GLB62203.1 hypothetical protein NCCP2495_00810 [Dietzia sp. NCCP-2495]